MLRSIREDSRIIGDLNFYGWVVARSVHINEDPYTAIDDISKKSSGKLGKWHEIEDHQNHKLNYNVSSHIPKEWSTRPLSDFFDKLQATSFG